MTPAQRQSIRDSIRAQFTLNSADARRIARHGGPGTQLGGPGYDPDDFAPRLDTVGGADVLGVTAEEFERKAMRGCDPEASEDRKRGCVVDGVAYPSISAAAKATGITAQAMWKRLRREAQLKAGNP